MDQNLNQEQEAQQAVDHVMPKDKKPGRAAVQIFAIIVLLALVGVGVYAWQNNRVAKQDSNVVIINNKSESKLQPEDVIASVKSKLAKEYTVLDADKNTQDKPNQVNIRTEKSSPVYQASGYGFYTNYDGGLSMYVTAPASTDSAVVKTADKNIRQLILDTYADLGLIKKQTNGSISDGTADEMYEGKGLVCAAYPTESNVSDSLASCGLLSEYPKAAAKAKPLADALGKLDAGTILGNVKITNSLVSGYRRAELGQGNVNEGGGSMALLYKKDGGSWKLFMNVQEAPSCSDYNTVDLRNAFKGEKCYDTKTNSSDAVVK